MLDFEIWNTFCAEPLKDFILCMLGGGLWLCIFSGIFICDGHACAMAAGADEGVFVFPFSMDEGPGTESKPPSSPSTMTLVYSLRFNLRNTFFFFFLDLPAWQPQLWVLLFEPKLIFFHIRLAWHNLVLAKLIFLLLYKNKGGFIWVFFSW